MSELIGMDHHHVTEAWLSRMAGIQRPVPELISEAGTEQARLH